MDLELTILGASSAIPLVNRNPTAQFLTICNRHFLIDCGEGTQVRIRENGIGFGRIDHILISHLHGDHFFGLAPLLSTLHLLDRNKEINIYGPKGLKEVVNAQIKAQGSWLKFPILFHELNFEGEHYIFEDDMIRIKSFPLNHGINCWGFLFEEKDLPRKMKAEAIEKYSIPVSEIKQIKKGADWTDEDGNLIPNSQLTLDAPKSLSYAFCTDTSPTDDLIEYVDSPDLLYHEATFLDKHKERAAQTFHSTSYQAAEVAKSVNARQLMIGHYSARYTEFDGLLEESREIFPNTILAQEGKTYVIKHKSQSVLQIKEA